MKAGKLITAKQMLDRNLPMKKQVSNYYVKEIQSKILTVADNQTSIVLHLYEYKNLGYFFVSMSAELEIEKAIQLTKEVLKLLSSLGYEYEIKPKYSFANRMENQINEVNTCPIAELFISWENANNKI